MKLENQVVSLDLAKRLKELGVDEDSLFYWVLGQNTWQYFISQSNQQNVANVPDFEMEECPVWFSAYTVAELGEMLSETLGAPHEGIKQYDVEQYKYASGEQYQLQVSDYVNTAPHLLFTAKANSEADARAKMLIYLLENKLITL